MVDTKSSGNTAWRWAQPFLDRLGHKRGVCVRFYISDNWTGDRKSVRQGRRGLARAGV